MPASSSAVTPGVSIAEIASNALPLDLALALAPTPQRVLVIGANGQTGSRVVRLLRDAPEFEPVAMLRLPEQQEAFNAMGVECVVADMDAGAPSAQHMDMATIDAVIYAAGAGRVRGPLKQVLVDLSGAIRSVVAAQESESVRRFVLLSGINTDVGGTRRSVNAAGADLDGPLASWHKLKRHSEIYLEEHALYGRELQYRSSARAASSTTRTRRAPAASSR